MEVNEKLNRFMELVLSENEKINLTSITDVNEFKEKHFDDSLLPSKIFDFKNKNIMDLGSGAGFPGIPLAIVFPDAKFTLVEPISKRCAFLNLVVKELDLKNVEVKNSRSEDLPKEIKYDVIISRAVSELKILLELSIPYLKVNGTLIAYKGKRANEEIEDAKNAFKILNAKIANVQHEFIDLTNERNNLFIIKTAECDKKFPRNYSLIKKKPL